MKKYEIIEVNNLSVKEKQNRAFIFGAILGLYSGFLFYGLLESLVK